jgi:hypothetical protein
MSYFEGVLPVPPGWDERPAAYLAFGDTYADERDEAARRHWPVTTLPGGHLQQLIGPDQVAAELVTLVHRLGINMPKNTHRRAVKQAHVTRRSPLRDAAGRP